jgi:hypothetical protein
MRLLSSVFADDQKDGRVREPFPTAVKELEGKDGHWVRLEPDTRRVTVTKGDFYWQITFGRRVYSHLDTNGGIALVFPAFDATKHLFPALE